MTAPYQGGCACGRVTATITGEPASVRQCWCRQCQQLSGGGPTHNAIFATADVVLTGELAHHDWLAASGNILTSSFCPMCGTPVMARSSARPQFKTMRLGFLAPDHGLAPAVAIWVEEAPSWACIDPDIEHLAGQPAPPSTSPETAASPTPD